MIKLGMIGANGKMGQRIIALAKENLAVTITGKIDLNSPDTLESCIDNVDVFIDFSKPEVTIANLKTIKLKNKALVIGTTGFSIEEIKSLKDVAQTIPIILSPNMSLGVNVFFKLVEQAAKYLNDYDTELIELHHNKKKDAPSGTAVKIANIVSEATGKNHEDWVYGREGIVGERTNSEIGIHAIRLGDVVGEHSLYFAGNSERIEITHRAHTRDNFAKGAIRAAIWLQSKKSGIYDMFDVLGLK
ncbi:MAG: 4-hydroxy-tetrahydrodipicolinate reductase [bacterium]|nr:4-hydroxy-tetrahydrodipicolinate reductase [bacterium]